MEERNGACELASCALVLGYLWLAVVGARGTVSE